jgi:hypothetical protein
MIDMTQQFVDSARAPIALGARIMAIAVTVLLLATSARTLPAQLPTPRSACDFDRITCEYSGVINVTNEEGAKEVIAASVVRGVVHCIVRYTDEEGTRTASGPGLIRIEVGLVPAPEDSLPPGGSRERSRLYTMSVACPHAAYAPPHEAAWSHPYDTYKRPGGEVGVDQRGQAVLPDVLEGSYNTLYEGGGGSLRMSWRLCRNCPPPPPPAIPPATNR